MEGQESGLWDRGAGSPAHGARPGHWALGIAVAMSSGGSSCSVGAALHLGRRTLLGHAVDSPR